MLFFKKLHFYYRFHFLTLLIILQLYFPLFQFNRWNHPAICEVLLNDHDCVKVIYYIFQVLYKHKHKQKHKHRMSSLSWLATLRYMLFILEGIARMWNHFYINHGRYQRQRLRMKPHRCHNCLCFGWYDSRRLLPNIMLSY